MTSPSSSFSLMRRFPLLKTNQLTHGPFGSRICRLKRCKDGAEILANGESTDLYSPGFTLVRTGFSKEHPDEVVRFLKVFNKAVTWQKEHKDEAVSLYAKIKHLDPKVVRNVLNNTEPLNEPINDDIVKAQQETADFQYQTKAIHKKIHVKDVVDNSFIKKRLKRGWQVMKAEASTAPAQ